MREYDEYGQSIPSIIEELLALRQDEGSQAVHRKWVESRPESVQRVANEYPFDQVYRFTGEDHRCIATGSLVSLASYFEEDDQVGVHVLRSPSPLRERFGTRHVVSVQDLEKVSVEELVN